MRALMFGLIALLVACPVLADDKEKPKIDPKLVVGKWEGENMVKFTVELTADGKVFHTMAGKEGKTEGTYTLKGDKLTMKVGDATLERTIKKVTEKELVSVDEKGQEKTFTRVKGK